MVSGSLVRQSGHRGVTHSFACPSPVVRTQRHPVSGLTLFEADSDVGVTMAGRGNFARAHQTGNIISWILIEAEVRVVGCTTARCYIREWRVFPGDLEVGHSTHLHPFVPWPDDAALHQSQAGYHALRQSQAGYPAYATRPPRDHPRNPNAQCIILHTFFFFFITEGGDH